MIKFMPIRNPFEIEGFCTAFNFRWSDNYAFSGERHNFWEIVFVKSGEVEITEDENVYQMGEGGLIFHAPMEFHRIKSVGGTEPTGFILSFCINGDLPESLTEGVFTLDSIQMSEYERICRLAVDFVSNPQNTELGQEASMLLSAFILRLQRNLYNKALSSSQSASEYRRIVSFMSENDESNLTVEEIARLNAVSVSYIKLLFSSYAGVSPKSYFNDLRLRKAISLLADGLSITEVATRMNFSSPSYFCTFYKKRVGYSPTKQRQNSPGIIDRLI